MNNTSVQKISISESSGFRGEILRQIYRVWLFRTFLPVLLAEVIVFSFVFYKFGQTVFMRRIAENAVNVFFSNPSGIFSFFVAAFFHASFLTKFLSVAIVVLLALLIRHITQGMLRFILVRQNYFSKIARK